MHTPTPIRRGPPSQARQSIERDIRLYFKGFIVNDLSHGLTGFGESAGFRGASDDHTGVGCPHPGMRQVEGHQLLAGH